MDHLKIAQLCIDAYSDQPDIRDKDNVVRAIIRSIDGEKVCGFAGTDPTQIHDLLTDVNAVPKSIPEIGWGHGGIFHAMLNSVEMLDEVVGDDPAWLCGHSLGGGLAEAYAYYRIISGKPILGLITFGKPMITIGPRAGRIIQGKPVTLYRHASDVIPLLPIRVPLLIEYTHPAVMTQLGKPGPSVDWSDIHGAIDRELAAHSMEATIASLKLLKKGLA